MAYVSPFRESWGSTDDPVQIFALDVGRLEEDTVIETGVWPEEKLVTKGGTA